ncbi:MAG: guanylate kinase [Desulfobacterales bacterium]|jgi:guanylate kinase
MTPSTPSADRSLPSQVDGMRRTTGRLFIISAPSGAGKSTLCRVLRRRLPDLRYSVSYTTRSPRGDEKNGVDYHFITQAAFRKGIKADKWAEWAEVHGNYYGTSAEFIDRALGKGRDVLLDIDVQGMEQILKRYPDSVTIFIMPPSLAALRQRLQDRGTDSAASISERLDNAAAEIRRKKRYRHIVVNDRLDEAVEKLTAIIVAGRTGRFSAAGENRDRRK